MVNERVGDVPAEGFGQGGGERAVGRLREAVFARVQAHAVQERVAYTGGCRSVVGIQRLLRVLVDGVQMVNERVGDVAAEGFGQSGGERAVVACAKRFSRAYRRMPFRNASRTPAAADQS